MIATLGIDHLIYLVSQQLGSHAIHASWPSLLDDYLTVGTDGNFELRDHDVEPHPAQFAAGIQHVLEAVADVVDYAFDATQADGLAEDLRSLKRRFDGFYRLHHAESE